MKGSITPSGNSARRIARALLVALAAALAAPPASARSSDDGPALTARPVAGASGFPAGATTLPGGALAYRPASAPAAQLPLVVLFQGYGFSAEQFMTIMTPVADRWGFMLVAPKAEHITWDMIYRGMNEQSRSRVITHSKPRFGKDIARIDAALKTTFASAPVDPKHVVLLGFSDGATYALSVGLANPQLFTTVISLSPGFVVFPDRVSKGQKVFVAHGTSDERLAFTNTRDGIVGPMEKAGMQVRFRPFEGRHVINRDAVREALAFALDREPPPLPK
jgi:predicted esterase